MRSHWRDPHSGHVHCSLCHIQQYLMKMEWKQREQVIWRTISLERSLCTWKVIWRGNVACFTIGEIILQKWKVIWRGNQYDMLYDWRDHFVQVESNVERQSMWHALLLQESPWCHSGTLGHFFLRARSKMAWPPEKSEQDLKYPITSLIFVVESQSLCLYPCWQGQGS